MKRSGLLVLVLSLVAVAFCYQTFFLHLLIRDNDLLVDERDDLLTLIQTNRATNGSTKFVPYCHHTDQCRRAHTSETEAKPLSILIAKTLSPNDAQDTIQDIKFFKLSLHPDRYHIQWKLFCYNPGTYQSLISQHSLAHWEEEYFTSIHLKVNATKVGFWYPFLDPTAAGTIPDDIDYIWLPDGDIRLRSMSWDCFWNLVSKFRPLIFAPSIMVYRTEEQNDKYYTGSTISNHCVTGGGSSSDQLERVVAMDVAMIECQLPIFARRAWEVVHHEFSTKIPQWGELATAWGPDHVWCSLVDQRIHDIDSMSDRFSSRHPSMMWQKVKETCRIDEKIILYLTPQNVTCPSSPPEEFYQDEVTDQVFPHTCMIFPSTPVEHLNTKSTDKHEKRKATQFYQTARRNLATYLRTFPRSNAGKNRTNVKLFRAYAVSNSTTEHDLQCQSCKHARCTIDDPC